MDEDKSNNADTVLTELSNEAKNLQTSTVPSMDNDHISADISNENEVESVSQDLNASRMKSDVNANFVYKEEEPTLCCVCLFILLFA